MYMILFLLVHTDKHKPYEKKITDEIPNVGIDGYQNGHVFHCTNIHGMPLAWVGESQSGMYAMNMKSASTLKSLSQVVSGTCTSGLHASLLTNG